MSPPIGPLGCQSKEMPSLEGNYKQLISAYMHTFHLTLYIYIEPAHVNIVHQRSLIFIFYLV